MKKVVLFIKLTLMTMLLMGSGVSLTNQNDISFETVKIGEQVWMAENLNVSKFRNGDPILQAKTNEEWIQAARDGKPAWCYYDNNPENGDRYGKLYNWFAVNDPRGLAPEGWEIPSFEDMKILTEYIDKNLAGFFDNNVSGRILKSTSGWADYGNGTNESDFSALPAGLRSDEGKFFNIGQGGHWWSSTRINAFNVWSLILSIDDYPIRQGMFKANGLSVRCIKTN